MTDTFKKLFQGRLTTTATPVYNVPAATQTIIKQIRIANVSTPTVTATLYNGALNTAFTNEHVILPATSIDPGGFAEFEGTITLSAGESFGGACGSGSNGALVITVYGLEIT